MTSLITIHCAAQCGAKDRVPAFDDRSEKNPAKRIKPVQVHPYICLACWRAGWRSDAPKVDGEPWRIYQGSPTT